MKEARLEEINRALEDPKVWDDPKRAQELGREKKSLDLIVLKMRTLTDGVRDAGELFEMARGDDDDATLRSVDADVATLAKQVADLEFQRMFNNPLDPNNCFIEIQAGAGGTEAQDWAGMLERMYLRYAERRGFKPELLDESAGEVAGIKGATIKISGDYAYGMLRTETGIHRLVRKSPFDSNARRHTSFASVFVYPEVDETIESRSIRPTCASTSTAPPAPAASTSTRPNRRCASRTCRPTSSCRARTTVRSTATAPSAWRC